MKITIQSTDEFVVIDGVETRVWKGTTENGVPCEAFVHGVGVAENDQAELDGLIIDRVPDSIAGRPLPGGQ